MNKSDIYPDNIKSFILTFMGIDPAYNGAWWFLTTYIILVIISQYINKIVGKYNIGIIFILSFVIYFIGYIQRIMAPIHTNNEIINYILRQA